MKVAALQMTSVADVAANLQTARTLLQDARDSGAALAVLPENFAFMGMRDADKLGVAESDGAGAIQDFLAETAQRLGLWIIGGTMALLRPGDARLAAASLVYDANGRRAARYDKIHLFDVEVPERAESYRESTHMAPGASTVVLDTVVGRIGLAVCYDVRFPELFRNLSAAGAELFVLPSAFTAATGRAHWETLLRARAIENLAYVIAPAQSGVHPNGRETYGDSMVVDYWGRILVRLAHGPGCITAEVDLARQAEVRRSFPALAHRAL